MENKTKAAETSVETFLAAIEPEQRRKDAERLAALMGQVSGLDPTLWGSNMIGFGRYHYRYDSGHSGETFRIGFSPRKESLVLYLGTALPDAPELLARLGKFKTGKACLYIKKLADVDEPLLRTLIEQALAQSLTRHP